MYIGAGLEKTKRQNNKFSVLIICPNGVFASRILMNKVQSIIRDIDSIDVGSLRDWSENDKKFDLVLSTVGDRKKTGPSGGSLS